MLSYCGTQPIVRNGILRRIPHSDFYGLRPYLQPVSLREREVLQELKRPIEYVHFIESGVVSMRTLESGNILETAMVSCQGAVGASVALGSQTSAHQSIVLVRG